MPRRRAGTTRGLPACRRRRGDRGVQPGVGPDRSRRNEPRADDDEMLAAAFASAVPLGRRRRRRAAGRRRLADRPRRQPARRRRARPRAGRDGPSSGSGRTAGRTGGSPRATRGWPAPSQQRATAPSATAGRRLLARCSRRLDDEEERELIGSQLASIPGQAPAQGAADALAKADGDATARDRNASGAAALSGVPAAYRLVGLDHVQVAMPADLEGRSGGLLRWAARPRGAREAAGAGGPGRTVVRER